MFEAEGFYVVMKRTVKKLILPLVEEIKEHITNERITLMGQFDASNERLSAAVTTQLRQTSEALQRLVDSDAEKAELQAELQTQVAQLDNLSSQLEADDPAPAPVEPPVVTEPAPAPAPVEPDAGFDTDMPVVSEPAPVVEQPVVEQPAPGTPEEPVVAEDSSDSSTPDPNAPAASH